MNTLLTLRRDPQSNQHVYYSELIAIALDKLSSSLTFLRPGERPHAMGGPYQALVR
jgi:hypothetical protein